MATITNAGKADVALAIKGEFDYLALGTGTTAESAAHTALVAETTTSGLARSAATMSTQTTTTTNDTSRATKQWTASGSVTVGESGLLDAASAGTMLVRDVKSPTKAVTSGDTYTNTTDIAVS